MDSFCFGDAAFDFSCAVVCHQAVTVNRLPNGMGNGLEHHGRADHDAICVAAVDATRVDPLSGALTACCEPQTSFRQLIEIVQAFCVARFLLISQVVVYGGDAISTSSTTILSETVVRFSKLLCLSVAIVLSTSSAIAGVQFQWTGITDGTIGGNGLPSSTFVADDLKLFIEVAPEAVQSGHISYHSPRQCGTPEYVMAVCPTVDSPISYFFASYGGVVLPIKLFPNVQTVWGWDWLDVEVDLTSAGFVSGTIDAYFHAQSEIHLAGQNGLFTAAFSADGGDCILHCRGAQGAIVESSSVPEPSTVALVAIALVGLVMRKYRPAVKAATRGLA
jgi:hypothetical protein